MSVSSYEVENWLDKLAKCRPVNGHSPTQEILEKAGPPPIPEFTHGDLSGQIEHYRVIRSIAVKAEDRYIRAAARADDMSQLRDDQRIDDDVNAEAQFWETVSQLFEDLLKRVTRT
jgi:hypothetical protein